jgi:hypothetical protein
MSVEPIVAAKPRIRGNRAVGALLGTFCASPAELVSVITLHRDNRELQPQVMAARNGLRGLNIERARDPATGKAPAADKHPTGSKKPD